MNTVRAPNPLSPRERCGLGRSPLLTAPVGVRSPERASVNTPDNPWSRGIFEFTGLSPKLSPYPQDFFRRPLVAHRSCTATCTVPSRRSSETSRLVQPPSFSYERCRRVRYGWRPVGVNVSTPVPRNEPARQTWRQERLQPLRLTPAPDGTIERAGRRSAQPSPSVSARAASASPMPSSPPTPRTSCMSRSAPCRLIDTRPAPDNVGTRATPLGTAETATFAGTGDVVGPCNIPTGISAIETNVTAVGATALTFLTFFASDIARPTTASLNPAPGQPPTPNSVTINLPAAGTFNLVQPRRGRSTSSSTSSATTTTTTTAPPTSPTNPACPSTSRALRLRSTWRTSWSTARRSGCRRTDSSTSRRLDRSSLQTPGAPRPDAS